MSPSWKRRCICLEKRSQALAGGELGFHGVDRDEGRKRHSRKFNPWSVSRVRVPTPNSEWFALITAADATELTQVATTAITRTLASIACFYRAHLKNNVHIIGSFDQGVNSNSFAGQAPARCDGPTDALGCGGNMHENR